MFRLHSLFAFQPEARLALRYVAALQHARKSGSEWRSDSDARLRERAAALREEARSREERALHDAEAIALISEAMRRAHGIVAYDCQLLAGLTLAEGRLAEMATGEGKTFVATLPAFCFALHGLGAHVATVNSYLAERDFEFAQPAFERLGCTIGLLPEKQEHAKKLAAYACDVTYGVGTEFGFDYLRDQLAVRAAGRTAPHFHETLLGRTPQPLELVQRGHAFAVVDEADSVLIDEARSPLIISVGMKRPSPHPHVYRLAAAIAAGLCEGEHFTADSQTQKLTLNASAERLAHDQLTDDALGALERGWTSYVEAALRARHQLRRDVHYVIRENAVVIVDEFTGRLCPDRTWRSGLHQAIEALAGVEITAENGSQATITRPAYFQLYRRICGMTGTAFEAATELSESYSLQTDVIPLNRQSRRSLTTDRVFADRASKLAAVVHEIAVRHRRGQPVLIGTRTIENSEELSAALAPTGIPFRVLNAKQDAEEAQIVEQAGEPGRVTIATNMAGRGAHIPIPSDSLRAGGLHVIGLERHESARIDRQLIGRAARQGQPGSAQFFVAVDDDLLTRHAPALASRLRELVPDEKGELPAGNAAHFRRVQRKVERSDREQRRQLARYDEWLDDLKQAL